MKLKRTKTVPVPIRLDEDTNFRLRRAAKRLGQDRSGVIRFAILTILPQIESGTIVLPAK